MIKNTLPELLMPAGNFEKLKFAFKYGADAVYAGVPIFSLRARENDFTKDTIKEAIEYTHKLGKRIYLTMNIYAHNRKVDRFLDAFLEMADLGPDGFIMTDPGLIHKSLKARPNSVIHLSTQANSTNWATVEFWRDLGLKRIILPRELTIAEMAMIHDKVPDIELEAFVHGAVCIAYSGRCLISNYLNHRDANQGTCTNSCRWQYSLAVDKQSLLDAEKDFVNDEEYHPLVANYTLSEMEESEKRFVKEQFEIDEDQHGTYIMNSKDLCAVELLKELNDAGISSFKVEGRSKSIYYVATTARAYRRATDDLLAERPFNPDNLRELVSTSNRTLITGFMRKNPKEYAINYEDGTSQPLTHRFAGMVQNYNPRSGIVDLNFKNKVQLGDTLEWITPDKTVSQKVEYLAKPTGERVDVAHGGLLYQTTAPFEPDEFTLVRLVLNAAVVQSLDAKY